MMVPNFEKLYEPYTADGATLEKSTNWLRKTTGAPDVVIQQIISETMVKLAEGMEFSREKCSCGCDIETAEAAIEHYMRRQVRERLEKANQSFLTAVQGNTQAIIEAHIAAENKAYIAEKMKPPHRLLDWQKSWVVRFFKWIS